MVFAGSLNILLHILIRTVSVRKIPLKSPSSASVASNALSFLNPFQNITQENVSLSLACDLNQIQIPVLTFQCILNFCSPAFFQCNLKPKFNYENKNDKKFKVVLRRDLFCRFQNSFFRIQHVIARIISL